MFLILLILISKEIPIIEVEGEISKAELIRVLHPSFDDRSIGELLSKEPGINIRRFGTEGSLSLITIRGANPSQTEFFLEGVPISLSPYSTLNIEDLPLQGIGRVEVAKEFIPSEFSTASIGGIVNIVLPDKGIPAFHYLRGEFSSFKTFRGTGYSIRNNLSQSYFFYLDIFHTDGDFKYENSNGTPFNPYDDYISNRRNNRTDRIDFLAKYTYHPSGLISGISITSNLFLKEQGIAGTDLLQSEKSSLKEKRGFFVGEMKLEDERFLLAFQPFIGLQEEVFSDPDGEIGLLNEEVEQDFLLWGMRARGSLKGFKRLKPSFSLIYSKSSWESTYIKPFTSSFPAQRNEFRTSCDLGFGLSKKIFIVPQILIYFLKTEGKGGLLYLEREEEISSYHFAFMPSLSTILKFSHHSLVISLGRYVRIPSFFELLGDRGVWMGNPKLKPEEGIKTSVDWKGDFKPLSSSVGFFYKKVKDLISYTQNSQWTFIAENISSASIFGFEGSFSRSFRFIRTGLNYTYLWTRDNGEIYYLKGKKLPLQPSYELYYFLDFDFLKGFSLKYELVLQGETFFDRANMRKMGLRTSQSLYLTKKITKGVRIHGYVENILDEKQLDIYSIPLPGRRFGVKVEGEIM